MFELDENFCLSTVLRLLLLNILINNIEKRMKRESTVIKAKAYYEEPEKGLVRLTDLVGETVSK